MVDRGRPGIEFGHMMTRRRTPPVLLRSLRTLAAATLALGAVVASGGPGGVARAQEPASSGGESGGLDVVRLRPDFYMIAGAGANVGVQVGKDGVIVVDAGSADRADAVVAAIRALTDQPIRYVIDTSADPDHVGGNEIVSKAGRTIFPLGNETASVMTNEGAASILATENVLRRMSAPYPAAAWPTEAFHEPRSYMYLNGEGVEILHQPAAHTDGDAVVFFRRSDVVVAGDVIDTDRFPVIDLDRGGSVQGEIDALNRLVDLAIPSIPLIWQEGGTYVIPGHGRVYEQLDVVEYRDMVTIIRDRVQKLIDEGRTLEEVQAAEPTRGYTRRYGSDEGPWTTRQFVEAVYRDLSAEKN